MGPSDGRFAVFAGSSSGSEIGATIAQAFADETSLGRLRILQELMPHAAEQ